jgi:hypothetical protein
MWFRLLALALLLVAAPTLAGVKEKVAALAPSASVLVMVAEGNESVAQGEGATGREMLSILPSVTDAILGRTGKADRPETATRMAMDAEFSDCGEPMHPAREPFQKVDQIEELRWILAEQRSAR